MAMFRKGLTTLVLLLCIVTQARAAEMWRNLDTINGYDGHVSSVHTPYFQDNDLVRVGGWGDWYVGMTRFDVSSLPSNVYGVSLWYYVASGSATVPMTMYAMATPFGPNQYWLNGVSVYQGSTRNVVQPQSGNWVVLDITDYYRNWKSGSYQNQGILLVPNANNNQFNNLLSANYTTPSDRKPFLLVSYTEQVAPPSPTAQLLSFPLQCTSPQCTTRYTQGAYTIGTINSVLDHSMGSNGNGYYQYGSVSNGRADGVIVAFNGERVSGQVKPSDPVCVGGIIFLRPTSNSSPLVNTDGCGSGYASYDDHPGYDYKAAIGTPVYAAASGNVVNNGGQACVIGNMGFSCVDWGMVGIEHPSGHITQYAHLSQAYVSAGTPVTKGQLIGLSGSKSPQGISVGPHLHFEVLRKLSNGTYAVVDPYGWVGTGTDLLQTIYGVAPSKLWQ